MVALEIAEGTEDEVKKHLRPEGHEEAKVPSAFSILPGSRLAR